MFYKISILLILVMSPASIYANCNKDEVTKFINMGFSKSEIDGLCKKTIDKPKVDWINPSTFTCLLYGGSIENGLCLSNFDSANQICRKNDGKLPTISEFKQLLGYCGLSADNQIDFNVPKEDEVTYRDCIRSEGFEVRSNYSYWSSSINEKYSDYTATINFYNDEFIDTPISREFVRFLRCTK